MNPFPTRQAAEAYLSKITDAGLRDATRARLGLDEVAALDPRRDGPTMTANDISTPKKAEDVLLAHAGAGSEFALSGSEQNPDQGGDQR